MLCPFAFLKIIPIMNWLYRIKTWDFGQNSSKLKQNDFSINGLRCQWDAQSSWHKSEWILFNNMW